MSREMSLVREAHAKYIRRVSAQSDSLEFALSEHLRLSGVYWGACALDLLGQLHTLDREFVVNFVKSCAQPNGGYAGNVGHDAHLLYTLSAIQVLALFDAMDELDEDAVMQYVQSLQNEDGSFKGDEWGEVDTRFSYCAICCSSLLGRLDQINLPRALAYIKQCENFDGGFGCEPGGESHAGQVFTCVGALAIGDSLELCSGETLSWWLCERQTPGGGLNGRPQKDADVCYSWWVLSSLTLLRRASWVDASALRAFILGCQDVDDGGISDKPGDEPDVFHTFFGIAGLSLLGTDGVPPIDAAHALPVSVMERLKRRRERRAAAATDAHTAGAAPTAAGSTAAVEGAGERTGDGVPTVSLKAFLDDDGCGGGGGGDDDESGVGDVAKRRVAALWDAACKDVGFVKVVDHGVPAEIVRACWRSAADFFDRPIEEKRAVAMSDDYPYGYQGFGSEHLAASLEEEKNGDSAAQTSAVQTGDPKELFNVCIGASGDADAPTPRWPRQSEEMQAAWTEYYRHLSLLSSRLLRVCALALGLPETWFDAYMTRHRSVIRAINYPADEQPSRGQLRASTHTDYGAFTVLRLGGASADGLQLMRRDGSWIDVCLSPGEDCFVINLGDLMARWTNDRWVSTPHRVVNLTTGEERSSRRQSIAFFCNVNMDAKIACIPTCVDAQGGEKYPPITAGEHLLKKHWQTMAGNPCKSST